MEHLLLEIPAAQFVNFDNDIFMPLTLKTDIIKNYLYSFVSEISNFISIIYTVVYPYANMFFQIMKRDTSPLAKIYKFIFYDNSLELWQIMAIMGVVCFGIYVSELLSTLNNNVKDFQQMKSDIKQNKLTIDLLQIQLEAYESKFRIVVEEIDAIHEEMSTYLKKVKKIERDVKKLDYY
jgi:hypothetical protein